LSRYDADEKKWGYLRLTRALALRLSARERFHTGLSETKGGVCVSTVCTTGCFILLPQQGWLDRLEIHMSAGSSDDADGAVGIFSTRASPYLPLQPDFVRRRPAPPLLGSRNSTPAASKARFTT
jgi:hypothetical protein